MTLLFELVGEFIGRTAAWLATATVLSVVGLGVASIALRLTGRRLPLPSGAWAALAGALLGASLASRFDLPEALEVTVWRRSLPVAWAIGGALIVAAVWALAASRRSATDAS